MKQKLLLYKPAFVVLALLVYKSACCQLSIQAMPSEYRTYDAITNFSIRNSSTDPVTVSMRIELSEETQGNVLTVTVPEAIIKPGVILYRSLATEESFRFSNNTVSRYLQSNDRLADGRYRLCYYVQSRKAGVPDESYCTKFTISNSSPLVLVAPADGSALCDERPTFQWVSPRPLPADAKTRLVLTEIKEGQNETEAMYRNMPEVNIMEAGNSTLPLPSYVERLKENVRYAWQVTVYNNAGVIQKSEIWTFRKSCSNEKSIKKNDETFPELKKGAESNYYLVKEAIRFSFVNSFSVEKLDYVIIDLQTNKPIRYYPEVQVHTGLNQVEIDVDDCRGLNRGKYYMVRAINVQNSPIQMRFRYDDK